MLQTVKESVATFTTKGLIQPYTKYLPPLHMLEDDECVRLVKEAYLQRREMGWLLRQPLPLKNFTDKAKQTD